MGTMLAAELKALRQSKKMSQRAFAEATGLGESMIGQVETRRRLLGIESIDQLVASLGLGSVERQRLIDARAKDRAEVARAPIANRIDDVEATLAEVLARLDALDGGSPATAPASAKVTALNPRQRSRKAEPDFQAADAKAADSAVGKPHKSRPKSKAMTRPSPDDGGSEDPAH